MFIEVILIALLFIALLIALPFIFKCIFKTQKYMGYSIGFCSSALTIAAIIGIITIALFLFDLCFGNSFKLNISVGNALEIGRLIFIFFSILVIYFVIFIFIFYYTKGISNPNQPYNCVFMFIAGYLLPLFALIYLFFIFISFYIQNQRNSNDRSWRNVFSGIFILVEFFILFFMIQIAGTIMLSMLHHRKVNKSILYILLVCYFSPILLYLIAFLKDNNYLLLPNVVMILAIFGFSIFFYCKYANHEYPNPEILEPSDI